MGGKPSEARRVRAGARSDSEQREVSALRVWPTVFVIAVLALGLFFVGGCGRAEEAEETATQAIEQATEGAESLMEDAMAVDPVCGMNVAMKEGAVTTEYEGKTYYFCSEQCRDQFMEDPAAHMSEEGMMEEGTMHEGS